MRQRNDEECRGYTLGLFVCSFTLRSVCGVCGVSKWCADCTDGGVVPAALLSSAHFWERGQWAWVCACVCIYTFLWVARNKQCKNQHVPGLLVFHICLSGSSCFFSVPAHMDFAVDCYSYCFWQCTVRFLDGIDGIGWHFYGLEIKVWFMIVQFIYYPHSRSLYSPFVNIGAKQWWFLCLCVPKGVPEWQGAWSGQAEYSRSQWGAAHGCGVQRQGGGNQGQGGEHKGGLEEPDE